MDASIIPYLFLATFIIALGLGVVQYLKASKAKDEHHRSASARVHDEPRAGGGTRQD